MISRSDFVKYWGRLGEPDSVIWAYEKYLRVQSRYFVLAKNLNPSDIQSYWSWCQQNLEALPICYSDDDKQSWWGFQSETDALIWMLRWC